MWGTLLGQLEIWSFLTSACPADDQLAAWSTHGTSSNRWTRQVSDTGRVWVCSLGCVCPPWLGSRVSLKVYVWKACFFTVVLLRGSKFLKSGTYWQEVRSLGMCPFEGDIRISVAYCPPSCFLATMRWTGSLLPWCVLSPKMESKKANQPWTEPRIPSKPFHSISCFSLVLCHSEESRHNALFWVCQENLFGLWDH